MMKRAIRTGITGALLVGATAGLVAMGTVRPSGAPVPPAANDFTIDQNLGKLEIVTDAGGYLEIRYTGSLGNESHVISPKKNEKCKVLHLGEAAALMDLKVVSYAQNAPFDPSASTATVGTFGTTKIADVGLVDNGLGSYNQLNCNQGNGRLEPGQGFAISLGSKFTNAGAKVDFAEFDIEGKFGSRFEAQTNAASPGRTDYVLALGNASDNNADAGSSDNDRPQVGNNNGATSSDDFTSISIAPASADLRGELALEGGGDYTEVPVTSRLRTVFYLGSSKTYEYKIDCTPASGGPYATNPSDQTVQAVQEDPSFGDWSSIDDDPTDTEYPKRARLFRYLGYTATGTAKTDCPPIYANLSATPAGGVLLDPSTTDAALRVELQWVIPMTQVDLVGDSIFDREIDVTGSGTNFEPAKFCTQFTDTPASTANSFAPYDEANPGFVEHPADTPWCVISDERNVTVVNGVDVVIQTMVWDGAGDPRWL
jgi:hypothetical protein